MVWLLGADVLGADVVCVLGVSAGWVVACLCAVGFWSFRLRSRQALLGETVGSGLMLVCVLVLVLVGMLRVCVW
jgi:hypothetical protein